MLNDIFTSIGTILYGPSLLFFLRDGSVLEISYSPYTLNIGSMYSNLGHIDITARKKERLYAFVFG